MESCSVVRSNPGSGFADRSGTGKYQIGPRSLIFVDVIHGFVVSEELNCRLSDVRADGGLDVMWARPGVTGVGATIFDGQRLPLAALAVYGSTGYLLKNIRAKNSSLPSMLRGVANRCCSRRSPLASLPGRGHPTMKSSVDGKSKFSRPWLAAWRRP